MSSLSSLLIFLVLALLFGSFMAAPHVPVGKQHSDKSNSITSPLDVMKKHKEHSIDPAKKNSSTQKKMKSPASTVTSDSKSSVKKASSSSKTETVETKFSKLSESSITNIASMGKNMACPFKLTENSNPDRIPSTFYEMECLHCEKCGSAGSRCTQLEATIEANMTNAKGETWSMPIPIKVGCACLRTPKRLSSQADIRQSWIRVNGKWGKCQPAHNLSDFIVVYCFVCTKKGIYFLLLCLNVWHTFSELTSPSLGSSPSPEEV